MAEDAKIMGDAEALLGGGKAREAADLVKTIAPHNPLAKKILWDCYVALDDHKAIVAEFYPPATAAEIIYVADALWGERDRARLKVMLALDVVTKSTDPAVIKVCDTYRARLGL